MQLYKLPIGLLLAVAMASPGYAQSTASGGASVSPDSAQSSAAAGTAHQLTNGQTNESTVGGALYNTQVNQGYLSEPSQYTIRDIRCNEPTLGLAATYSAFIGTTIVASISAPLSSRVCQQVAQEYLEQTQLDTYLNSLKFCIELANMGYTVVAQQDAQSIYLANVCSTLSQPVSN